MSKEYALRTANCKGCGTEFTRRMRPGTSFCSHECYAKMPKPACRKGKEVACVQCQAVVYVQASRKPADQYSCSIACANLWQGRNKTTHACKTCGEAFKKSRAFAAYGPIVYCSVPCRDADPARAVRLREMNRMQQVGMTTSIERIGYALLNSMGVEYIAQHMMAGRFCVDAFIPAANLVVQFDGDYWHGHPAKFTVLDARQARRARLDKSQDAYFAACGIGVIRFWETDIKHGIEQVRERLNERLAIKG